MINSSVSPTLWPEDQGLIKNCRGFRSSVGELSGRSVFILSAASEPEEHSRISGPDTMPLDSNGKNNVTGKPLEKRTLSALNQLAAGSSAMAGSAWVRGVSVYHPANLAMGLVQQAPGLVATVCPDCPGLISAARSAAHWGLAYSWANSIYTAMATGNIPAVAATAALCGVSYACHHVSQGSVGKLCARLPSSLREYGEPWLQAATRVAVAGALRAAETVGTNGTGSGNSSGNNGRFIVPSQEASCPATGKNSPADVVHDVFRANNLDVVVVVKSALNGILQLPLAEAGLIRSYTPEQQKGHLLEAACQLLELPPQCPDMANATRVPDSNNGTFYQADTGTSGWVSFPGNQTFHYQLFSADPDSPLVVDAEDNQIPAPDLLRLAQATWNNITENTQTVASLPPDVGADQPSARLTPARPEIQDALDPGTDIKNSTMLVMNPCNAVTGEPEASVLVLSADHEARNVTVNIGTYGFPKDPSLCSRQQSPPDNRIRFAKSCQIEQPGSVSGRLEVFVDGQWGTVCRNGFDSVDARVACAQLGHHGAIASMTPLPQTCPEATGPILLANLHCTGNETSLLDCNAGGGVNKCLHLKDVAVNCHRWQLSTNGCDTEPAFVLGRLRVLRNGTWGSVCNRAIGDGNAICQSLGFRGGRIKNTTGSCPTDHNEPIHWANLNCNGTEASPFGCLHNNQTDGCDHDDDVVLNCGPDVRLVQCQTTFPGFAFGRFEVSVDGQWGTVCGLNFDPVDARVACTQLGFNGDGGFYKSTTIWSECPTATGPVMFNDVRCTGNEASLLDCSQQGYSCVFGHSGAGVGCPLFKLSTKDRDAEPDSVPGRLRVFDNGIWRDAGNRDMGDGNVTCNSLGFPGGRIKNNTGSCSTGEYESVHRVGLGCKGTEKSPYDCVHNMETESCTPNDEVVLICNPAIRLSAGCQSEGPGYVAGRLEVFVNRGWRTVCDDNFDLADARVACTQLGYPGAMASIIPVAGSCLQATAPTLSSEFFCSGNEQVLLDCPHGEEQRRNYGPYGEERRRNCGHQHDVAVKCQRFQLSTNGCVAEPGSVLGKLRVFHNGTWGSVCNRGVGDGHALCQSLGFSRGAIKNTTVCPTDDNEPIHRANLNCNGTGASLFSYSYNQQAEGCSHDEDVVLSCGPDVRLAQCQINTPGIAAGRLEVFADDRWGTVSDDLFDLADARVTCTQLGFDGDMASIISLARTCPPANNPVVLENLKCTGSEKNLLDCPHDRMNAYNLHYDVAVACQLFKLSTEGCDVEPRFVLGRLREFHNGAWGSVCNHRDIGEGNTICKNLGFPGGGIKNTTGLCSATGSGPIHRADLSCNETEASPQGCSHNEQTEACSYDDEVVLSCGPVVRLAQCQISYSRYPGFAAGRLEVWADGQWGTVCFNDFDVVDARVACTQLGFSGDMVKKINMGSWFMCPPAPGPILLDNLQCTGNETSLLDCSHSRVVGNYCSLSHHHIGVVCPLFKLSTKGCDTEPGSVPGRLRVLHNGTWTGVCNRGMGDGNTTCQNLGFSGGAIENTTRLCATDDNEPIHRVGLSCNGTLYDCLHHGQTEACSPDDEVVLSCGPVVRRAARRCQSEGANVIDVRLEVFADGGWGAVCNDVFASADARVVCDQLGYPDAMASIISASGRRCQTTGLIFRCTGNSTDILDCHDAGMGAPSCDEVMAVRCRIPTASTIKIPTTSESQIPTTSESQIPTTSKPPTASAIESASAIKRTVSDAVVGAIGGVAGGVALVFVSRAVYKNAIKLRQYTHEELSTCQLIRKAVMITITKPCNRLPRTMSTQSLISVVPASSSTTQEVDQIEMDVLTSPC